jgi:hypothetical protein
MLPLHTYRELVPGGANGENNGRPACRFFTKIYAADLDVWLDHLWRAPGGRLVHFVRDPIQMVTSGYLYHRRGSEPHWTNVSTCSRDLCTLPEARARGQDARGTSASFADQSAQPWLSAFGCPDEARTYWECLQMLPTEAGLRVEARRASATLTGMVDIAAIASGPRTFQLHLDNLLPSSFNTSVAALARWLGASDVATKTARVVGRSSRACFGAAKVLRVSTQQGLLRPSHPKSQPEHDSALQGTAARGITAHTRELSNRIGNATPRSLFKASSYTALIADTRAAKGRGIVHCTAPHLLASTLRVLSHLRRIGCALAIEAWHVRELHPQNVTQLQAVKGVRVRDLHEVLSAEVAADPWEVAGLRGFMCKPLSLLASDFDEVMLVDHDSMFLSDPTRLLKSRVFLDTGMLLFRDRVKRQVVGEPVKDPPRYLRSLIRRRLGWKGELEAPRRPGAPELSLPLLPWPWRPSAQLIGSPMATGESAHFIDSSVLLLSKRRTPLVVAALYRLHELYRHELYANLHGDKETFWIACELVGGLSCGVSVFLAGEMGKFRSGNPRHHLPSCMRGNLLQFNPEDGSAVHCNCKLDDTSGHRGGLLNYTHLSQPVRAPNTTRNGSRADLLLSVTASSLRPNHPLQLSYSVPTGVTSNWSRKSSCLSGRDVRPMKGSLVRVHGKANIASTHIGDSLCANYRLCLEWKATEENDKD